MRYLLFYIVAVLQLSCHLGFDPKIYDRLETGIVAAKEKHVKVFVVFDVFGSPTQYVTKMLQDRNVIAALNSCIVLRLMCDDKRMLNDSVSIGRINSNFQEAISGKYYQPMFCFLDENGKRISPCFGYAKKEELIKFIEDYIE